MPHLHIGLMPAITVYLMWLLVHIFVQLLAVQIHATRFGQALAMYG